MKAQQVKASKIQGWVRKYGTIGAIKQVRDLSGDDLRACHNRVLSLISLWRRKGVRVEHTNSRLRA